MKNTLLFLWEIIKIVFIALLIVLPIRYFIFQPFIVVGSSMEPNFYHGDYLIVDRLSYRFREPQRGDIIVFKLSNNFNRRYIKRIVGLPGETIEIKDGQVIVFDGQNKKILNEVNFLGLKTQTMGNVKNTLENEFFVLGDNRNVSSDSRQFGPLYKENIIGRVVFRLWPFDALTKFKVPEFSKTIIKNYE